LLKNHLTSYNTEQKWYNCQNLNVETINQTDGQTAIEIINIYK